MHCLIAVRLKTQGTQFQAQVKPDSLSRPLHSLASCRSTPPSFWTSCGHSTPLTWCNELLYWHQECRHTGHFCYFLRNVQEIVWILFVIHVNTTCNYTMTTQLTISHIAGRLIKKHPLKCSNEHLAWQRWHIAIRLSSRCGVCEEVVYMQWPTHCICRCLYYWLSQAVSGAFYLDPRALVSSLHPHPLPIKPYLLIPRVNKGLLELNTRSSKRKTAKNLGGSCDLSREGWSNQ